MIAFWFIHFIFILTKFEYPIYQVCCNVTDLEKSISCVENVANGENKTVWTNIHVRNATIDELDISLKLWKLLDSLAVTDGSVNRIVREFPKFSQPKCLNMSNNNLHTIPTRALKDLTRLQTLDLSYNNLTTVPSLNNLNLALDVRWVKHAKYLLCCSQSKLFFFINNFRFILSIIRAAVTLDYSANLCTMQLNVVM